jgi:hypothetical protein
MCYNRYFFARLSLFVLFGKLLLSSCFFILQSNLLKQGHHPTPLLRLPRLSITITDFQSHFYNDTFYLYFSILDWFNSHLKCLDGSIIPLQLWPWEALANGGVKFGPLGKLGHFKSNKKSNLVVYKNRCARIDNNISILKIRTHNHLFVS